ncbi:MAG TPA: RidA family protein [Spirochaetota bacterium]|nr:RidA family protein [Spirochaetota bacterium]HOS33008.1 RidA family protein [Spirochaetota bacterium]HOS55375.1 RidA family protein [Spirochaetota bacterium]HPK61738.1 RidA family protein [Spirochaetota bacterium]HQF77886.1 RidA family protein [Spirochaetota bacterium]
MRKTKIESKDIAPPVGPYNHAVSVSNLIFLSGQIPLDKNGSLVAEGVKEQTLQCLNNIEAVLKTVGKNREDIVKTTIFLVNMNDFNEVNAVYSAFFENTVYPARTTVEVGRLPREAKIEIEAIAAY